MGVDSRRPHRSRRGAALLEVLVALTIMAWAAASWATLASQTQQSISQLRTREREYQLAGAQLDRMSIWTRGQFLAHIGEYHLHGQVLLVKQVGPALFSAIIADSTTRAPLLTTTFYVNDRSSDALSNAYPSRP